MINSRWAKINDHFSGKIAVLTHCKPIPGCRIYTNFGSLPLLSASNHLCSDFDHLQRLRETEGSMLRYIGSYEPSVIILHSKIITSRYKIVFLSDQGYIYWCWFKYFVPVQKIDCIFLSKTNFTECKSSSALIYYLPIRLDLR